MHMRGQPCPYGAQAPSWRSSARCYQHRSLLLLDERPPHEPASETCRADGDAYRRIRTSSTYAVQLIEHDISHVMGISRASPC